MIMDKRLLDMLSYKRPYGSKSEAAWIKRFILPYNPEVVGTATQAMVYIVTVNNADGSTPNVLFSAHTDTVHRTSGRQTLVVDRTSGYVSKEDGEPLGADDGAGVWLLLEMIDANVPGVYTFPVGEEKGGIGSSWLAENAALWLKQFDYAIAFDRKGTDSVITHQSVGMCCSDTFATALSNALNVGDFMYSPDDSGVYTDTAEYTDIIAECTNISCGYYNEHTQNERLDVLHLMALRDVCVELNWAALPVSRTPGDTGFTRGFGYAYGGRRSFDILDMTRAEMIAAVEEDYEGFIDQLRSELGLPEDDEDFPDDYFKEFGMRNRV